MYVDFDDFGHLQTSLDLPSSFDNQFITDRNIKEKSPYMHIKDLNKKKQQPTRYILLFRTLKKILPNWIPCQEIFLSSNVFHLKDLLSYQG